MVTPQRSARLVQEGVRLTPAERAPVLTRVNPGRAAAATLFQARIWLNAAVGAGARRWTAAEIAAAVDTSAATVHRVRQAWVDQGRDAALARQPPPGRP